MKKRKKEKTAQTEAVECSYKNRYIPIKATVFGKERECAVYYESICEFCGVSPKLNCFYGQLARNAAENAVSRLGVSSAAELESASTARERCAWRKPELRLVCRASVMDEGAKISVNTELRLHRGTKSERIYGYNLIWDAKKGTVLSCKNI